MIRLLTLVLVGSLLAGTLASPALAEPREPDQAAAGNQTTTTGTVVSVTRSTLLIRTADGMYHVYVIDASTTKPNTIPLRATVSVQSTPAAAADQAPAATLVRVTAPPPPPSKPGEPGAPATQAADEPVPVAVRQLEDSIKQSAKRYHIGIRGGFALDPELVMFGAQAQFGPFFNGVAFQPSLEFGFGEITTLIAVNLDAMYRLAAASPTSRWSTFVGGGPGFNFSKRSFSTEGEDVEDESDRFSFSDLTADTGFNLFVGLQNRSGMFIELRATAYSSPHMRLTFGYNF
jgi:hypothetical protein